MKKVLASLFALIMALTCIPLTASASSTTVFNRYFPGGDIEKPQKPYIHVAVDDAWDGIYLYEDVNWDINWFADCAADVDAFMADNGLDSLNAYIQIDYKIDDNDWHYTTDWDNGSYNSIPNYGLHCAEYAPSISELSNKMIKIKLSDAISYNFDEPTENGDFYGCVSRSGAYPDYTNYHYDLTNHTIYYRYRYKLDATDSEDPDTYNAVFSDWSDEASIGKNGTQQNLTKPTSVAALTIIGDSHLNIGSDEEPINGFWLDFDIPKSIYDDLKYYEIVEGLVDPVLFEVQYRVNGGSWKEGGIANPTCLEVDKMFSGTDAPLKKGDKVEFRARIAEGPDKDIKGPWSNIYAIEAPVTDYTYTEAPIAPAPPITELDEGATEEQVDSFITGLKSDSDAKGSTFYRFPAKQSKVTSTSIKISWNKVSGASYYIVYGNKCGKTNRYVKIKKVKTLNFTQSKLKKGTYYKYIVSAFNKKGKHLATSRTMHIATKGGKYCNFKSVTTKAKKNAVSLARKGKTFKLGAKAVKESSKLKANTHRKIRFESSNKKIATVDSSGKITAKKKGTCYVYAYAQNGVYKKIKVTVKK